MSRDGVPPRLPRWVFGQGSLVASVGTFVPGHGPATARTMAPCLPVQSRPGVVVAGPEDRQLTPIPEAECRRLLAERQGGRAALLPRGRPPILPGDYAFPHG